jgi:site-specific DNA-cytosine methylase
MSVVDPRAATAYQGKGKYRVTGWDDAGGTVIAASSTGDGAFAIADPRVDQCRGGTLGVVGWDESGGTIAGENLPSNGAFAVADRRPGLDRTKGDDYYGAGHFGVVPWDAPSGAVSAAAGYDNGRWSVADPRPALPAATDRLVAVIRALDGTWHRPFTTFELAGLQSLVEPEEQLELDGLSDAEWRERIGNAVPPDAAQAIAWSGTAFMLSNVPIWVRSVAVGLAVNTPTTTNLNATGK